MFLVFQPIRSGVAYGAFTASGDSIYDGFLAVNDWLSRDFQKRFTNELTAQVRGHGKVFQQVGIVLPFGENNHIAPKAAGLPYLKGLASTKLRQKILEPSIALYASVQKAWPHLPVVFLSDSYLSAKIERTVALPPLAYDAVKKWHVSPYLLHSYGHKANMLQLRTKEPVISLYVANQWSVALFENSELKDAQESYTPHLQGMGVRGAQFDGGFISEILERRLADVPKLLLDDSGLLQMTETQLSLDELLQLSGLVPRKDAAHLEKLSIETIEWIELSARQFVRSLRHAIASMTAVLPVEKVVVNTSFISEASPLWSLVFAGGLSHLRVKYTSTSILMAACQDLIAEK